MDTFLAARLQMVFSLGFHMIFAALGVGMPLLMVLAEAKWLRTANEAYLNLTKSWAKAVGILFGVGTVSGTVLSLELGLLWPSFMSKAGGAIGPAFTLESFAFFIEAIFVGLYLYGWQRLTPRAHWLVGIPVAIAGAASSVLVTAANAWMQYPLELDRFLNSPHTFNPAAALLQNPYWPLMAIHSTIACYAATAFVVAGIYAWSVLHGKRDELHLGALRLSMAMGLVAAMLMPLTGHASALVTARLQPAKLAAMEAHFQTEKGADLRIGGIPDVNTGTVRYAFNIPSGLSILAYGNPNAEVTGLDKFPRSDWPNVSLTHYAFQIMVGAGMVILLAAVWFWWTWWRTQGKGLFSSRLMHTLVAVSPLGFVSLETGWIVTEVGRQPWIIYGMMRTQDAVTPATSVVGTLVGVLTLYITLTGILIWLLLRVARQNTSGITPVEQTELNPGA